jgi:hypothetical protein
VGPRTERRTVSLTSRPFAERAARLYRPGDGRVRRSVEDRTRAHKAHEPTEIRILKWLATRIGSHISKAGNKLSRPYARLAIGTATSGSGYCGSYDGELVRPSSGRCLGRCPNNRALPQGFVCRECRYGERRKDESVLGKCLAARAFANPNMGPAYVVVQTKHRDSSPAVIGPGLKSGSISAQRRSPPPKRIAHNIERLWASAANGDVPPLTMESAVD